MFDSGWQVISNISSKRIFYCLLAIDLCLVFIHIIFGITGNIHPFVHLDFEQNLPTIYQSAKLIGFGLIYLYFAWWTKLANKTRNFLLPLSLVLIFVGFDELLQIHENIYRIFEFMPWLHPSKIVDLSMKAGYKSSLWIIYYIPLIFVFVFWSGYWLRYFQSVLQENAKLLLVSSACLFVVLLAEIISSTGIYSQEMYFWLITIEETAEMLLGSSLVLVGWRTLILATQNNGFKK